MNNECAIYIRSRTKNIDYRMFRIDICSLCLSVVPLTEVEHWEELRRSPNTEYGKSNPSIIRYNHDEEYYIYFSIEDTRKDGTGSARNILIDIIIKSEDKNEAKKIFSLIYDNQNKLNDILPKVLSENEENEEINFTIDVQKMKNSFENLLNCNFENLEVKNNIDIFCFDAEKKIILSKCKKKGDYPIFLIGLISMAIISFVMITYYQKVSYEAKKINNVLNEKKKSKNRFDQSINDNSKESHIDDSENNEKILNVTNIRKVVPRSNSNFISSNIVVLKF